MKLKMLVKYGRTHLTESHKTESDHELEFHITKSDHKPKLH